jgi:hypothetical protein
LEFNNAYTAATVCPLTPAFITFKGKTRFPSSTGAGAATSDSASALRIDKDRPPLGSEKEWDFTDVGNEKDENDETTFRRAKIARILAVLEENMSFVNWDCFERLY